VRHAAGQFRHVYDEGVVFVTPPNDHFVSRILHALEQLILREDFPNLLYLVRFRLRAVSLQIDSFDDTVLCKNMVASRNAHAKTLRFQQIAKLIKADISIGRSAENSVEYFFPTHDLLQSNPAVGVENEMLVGGGGHFRAVVAGPKES
jgi:hypothetical protein